MSTIEATTRWMEKSSDWLNPILVKETRQALKSRQFVVTFLLLLIACWLISIFFMLSSGDAIEYDSMGRTFFAFYYFVLSVAIFVIVPYGAFRSLLNERDLNTFELLSITTLSPRQIVWGKLFSALVQVFIYYSAIAPFIAFTSLLQGFDLAQVAYVLAASMLGSLAASMAALMLSTGAKHRHWQALMSLIVLAGLIFLLFAAWGLFQSLFMFSASFDDPEFWWITGFVVTGGLSYVVLCQQITTAQLTFESGNRSTGIRATCSVQFFMLWIGIILFAWYRGVTSSFRNDEVMALAVLSAMHWSVVGLFAVSENEFLSRRIRRDLPHNTLLRIIIAPFIPGSSRGLIYILLHLAILLALSVGLRSWNGGSINEILTFVTALCCYVWIYLGLGSVIGRWGRKISGEIRPAHTRVLMILLFAAGIIGPYIPYTLRMMKWPTGYSLIYISNPLVTLEELDGNSPFEGVILGSLLAAAAIVFLINFRALAKGMYEILKANIQARKFPQQETFSISKSDSHGPVPGEITS